MTVPSIKMEFPPSNITKDVQTLPMETTLITQLAKEAAKTQSEKNAEFPSVCIPPSPCRNFGTDFLVEFSVVLARATGRGNAKVLFWSSMGEVVRNAMLGFLEELMSEVKQ
ncbi:hypothetical protein NPIL_540181 [Nephila pilipes]|uniref:Uncharacterized protein n=1 Tax=Nephila pilipes TaxID=299642 RepID=A0A8X6N3X2_NEPPI|nr:hypothetical protein NPIL_540181 [Nephila pilipes]